MKIAVVGGGITGSLVASELIKRYDEDIHVVLFDQGRRGPGGRASHRSVAKKIQYTSNGNEKRGNTLENDDFVILPDDNIEDSALQFDHGCKCRRLLYTNHQERKRYD